MGAAYRFKNPKGELLEHFLRIARGNYIRNLSSEDNGFVLSENYEEIIQNATRLYGNEPEFPPFFLIIYSWEDTHRYFPSHMPLMQIEQIRGLDYIYAVMKETHYKISDYLAWWQRFVAAEIEYGSKGLFGLISEHPFRNHQSIKLHLALGLKRVGEIITSAETQLGGQPIAWGVYYLPYIGGDSLRGMPGARHK